MSFLAIIIALLLVQAWGSAAPVQHDDWFRSWQSRVGAMGVLPAIKLALAVLVPVALALLILDVLHPLLFGLAWIALAIALLLYSFGRGDFRQLMERYRHQCLSGDFEGAYLSTLPALDPAPQHEAPGSAWEVNNLVQRGFAYEGYQRWFAVLFYFAVLGPAGALAYRLLQLSQQSFQSGLSQRCLFLADWLPARLLALAFVLTGDFVSSRDKLLDALLDPSMEAGQLLFDVGLGALGVKPSGAVGELDFGVQAADQNRELEGLLRRSATCWVAVLSLLVLFF